MEDFLKNYGVEIILSVVSILFGIFVSYVFYRLQKRDVVSAQEERTHRATEELKDVLESYVINKKEFSKDTIRHLISASERAHRIELNDVCTPTSLLQDVSLGLQKSRHLDVTQKVEYADHIVKSINQLTASKVEMPTTVRSNLELIDSLEKAIQEGNKETTIEKVSILRNSLTRLEQPIISNSSSRSSFLTETVTIGLMGVLVSYLSLTDLLSLDTVEGFMIIYFIMILFLSVFIIGTPQGKRLARNILELMRRFKK